MTDLVLTAGVDTKDAARQIDEFVSSSIKKLSTIKAAAANAFTPGGGGGSFPGGGGGTSPGRSPAMQAANQALAQQRLIESALTRELSFRQRIARQIGDDAALQGRLSDAVQRYIGVVKQSGAGTLAQAEAHGLLQRALLGVNDEIVRGGGLLVTLNRNSAQTRGAITSLASALAGLATGSRGITSTATTAASSLSTLATASGAASEGLTATRAALVGTVAVAAGVVVGIGLLAAGYVALAKSTTEAHDRVSLLQQRLSVLAGSSEAGKGAFDALVKTSGALGVSLEDAGQAFSRFILAGKDIGLTAKDAGTLADTVLKLGRIGGASTAELTGGMIQLGQALASNRLGGDEFRSVMENLPLVARAIAKELGVNVGQLKALASEGKITADVVANALFGSVEKVNQQFEQLPRTASAMGQEIKNNFTLLLADLDHLIAGSTVIKTLYAAANSAVTAARNLINGPSEDQQAAKLQGIIDSHRAAMASRQNSILGGNAFADQSDAAAITKAQAELDSIRKAQSDRAQKEREEDLQAGLSREESLFASHRSKVEKIIDQTDPLAKAGKERNERLGELKAALDSGAISYTTYSKAVDSVNTAYDRVQDRANKAENALAKARDAVSESIAKIGRDVELLQSKRAALASSDPDDFVNTEAINKASDILGHFAVRTGQVGASLSELAKSAGIDLDSLLAKLRELSKEKILADADKRIRDLDLETNQAKRLADATLQSASAVREANVQSEIERTIREANLKGSDAQLSAKRAEVESRIRNAAAARDELAATQQAQGVLRQFGSPDVRLGLDLQEIDDTESTLAKAGKLTADLQFAFNNTRFDALRLSDTIGGTAIKAFDAMGDGFKDSLEEFPPAVASNPETTRIFTEAL